MQSFLKKPGNFFNKTKIGAKSLLSSGKKLGSTLMGTPIKVAQKLLPPTKQLAKERRQNDSSQFVKNYLDFFGAKKTAKILRNNLKITRDALVDMFETTKLLKIQIGNITNSLKRKGGKDGKKKGGGLGGLLGGGLGMLSGLLSVASLLTNPVVLGVLAAFAAGSIGVLLANEKTREAIFGFISKYGGKIFNFLKDSFLNVLKENFPNIFLLLTDLPGLVKNAVAAALGLQSTPAKIDIEFNELNKKLEAAGMDKDGNNKKLSLKDRRNKNKLLNEGRTLEQQQIYEEVMERKEVLEDLKEKMKNVEDEVPKSGLTKRKGKPTAYHTEEDKKIIREKQKEILNQGLLDYEGSKQQVKKVSESKVEGDKESKEVKEVSDSEVKEVSDNKVEGSKEEVKKVSESKVKGVKESKEVKEVSESKVEGVKEGDSDNVKVDTSKNMDIVNNIEKPIEEESDDPIIKYVPTAMSGSNNQPQVMGESSNPPPTGGGSPSIVFFPSKNFDTISDQTAKSLMNIVDG